MEQGPDKMKKDFTHDNKKCLQVILPSGEQLGNHEFKFVKSMSAWKHFIPWQDHFLSSTVAVNQHNNIQFDHKQIRNEFYQSMSSQFYNYWSIHSPSL